MITARGFDNRFIYLAALLVFNHDPILFLLKGKEADGLVDNMVDTYKKTGSFKPYTNLTPEYFNEHKLAYGRLRNLKLVQSDPSGEAKIEDFSGFGDSEYYMGITSIEDEIKRLERELYLGYATRTTSTTTSTKETHVSSPKENISG